MFKLLAAAILFLIACNAPGRAEPKDAPPDPPDVYVPVGFDAPPPSVDAGPPPAMSCSTAAPTCELPPSTCLDAHYLVYYTDGTCVGDMCQYTTNLMFCSSGCVNGGCQHVFT